MEDIDRNSRRGFLDLHNCGIDGLAASDCDLDFGWVVLREVKDGLFAETEVAACDEYYFCSERGTFLGPVERNALLSHLQAGLWVIW
jgi:hypothetical protein